MGLDIRFSDPVEPASQRTEERLKVHVEDHIGSTKVNTVDVKDRCSRLLVIVGIKDWLALQYSH